MKSILKYLSVAALALTVSLNAVHGAGIPISALPAEGSPAGADKVVIEDNSAGTTDSVTLTTLFANIPDAATVTGTSPAVTIGDGGAEDTNLNFDGNARDFHIILDDSADALEIGYGTVAETDERLTIAGSPTETVIEIGDAAEEDASIVIDGNAVDFRISLDDSADTLEIGRGSTIETTERITLGGSATETIITLHDATENDSKIVYDGNAQDFYLALDDSSDKFIIGLGSTVATTERLTFNSGDLGILVGDATAADVWFEFDGIAQNFHVGIDDSSDKLVIGLGSVLGTTERMTFNSGDLGILIGDDTQADVWFQADANVNDYVFGVDFSDGGNFEFGTGTALGDLNEIMSFGTGTSNTEVLISDGDPLDSQIRFDGNAQDFHIGLDDSADDLVLGVGSALGTTQGLSIDENADVAVEDNFTLTSGTLTHTGATVRTIVQLGVDLTTIDVSTGTVFQLGSNTGATAITDLNFGVAGQIVTIIAGGDANHSTIADSGNFNIAGAGGWTPDSADDSITFLIQADNDYIQIYGTQTDN